MCKIYGYCRISTSKQNIERQHRNILAQFTDAVIVEETYTGTSTKRPRWDRLKKQAEAEAERGETVTIIFDSVSRMSRNAEDGFQLYQELFNKNINLVFIKEPHINTAVYRQALNNSINATGDEIADIYIEATNRVLMLLAEKQIATAFEQAEKEVQDLHKRTSEGILTAKLAGKRVGRQFGETVITAKQKRAEKIIVEKNKDFGGQLSDAETMLLIGCSHNSFYKYKRICRSKASEV